MYETFEHTADLGLRIHAPDLDTLFAEAAAALFSTIVDDLGSVRHERAFEVRLPADDREYLLFDWLNQLLFQWDTEHMLFAKFAARLTANGLQATAWGEPLDRARHTLGHEVKAITYHELKVEQVDNGWLAEVIVDI